MDHIERAEMLISTGSGIDDMRFPSANDAALASAHALIAIAKLLADKQCTSR